MISVLLYIDNVSYDKALAQAKTQVKKRAPSAALGKVGESVTKGVFKSSREASTASGKADIVGVSLKQVANVIGLVEARNKVAVQSLNKQLSEAMGVGAIDIEAKATSKFLGGSDYKGSQRGTLKVTSTRATINPNIGAKDKDYIIRQKTLILAIVESELTGVKSSKIQDLFDALQIEVDGTVTRENLKSLNEQILRVVNQNSINKAFMSIMDDKVKFNKFMAGPFGALVKNKVRNLTVQVNAKSPKGDDVRFFQTFINLTFSNGDIIRRRDGASYSFYLSSSFEKKLLAQTKEKLLSNTVGVLEVDTSKTLEINLRGTTGLQKILNTQDTLENLIKSLSFSNISVSVPSGGSIALDFSLNAANLLNSLGARLPKILASNYAITKNIKKGKFASAAQLTALLRIEAFSRMKKSGIAAPPSLTTRTGRFVENLTVAQVNYKNSIIRYYSMPLYYSLEEYGYEVGELIEGSIREVTQKMYSRQFNLVRG